MRSATVCGGPGIVANLVADLISSARFGGPGACRAPAGPFRARPHGLSPQHGPIASTKGRFPRSRGGPGDGNVQRDPFPDLRGTLTVRGTGNVQRHRLAITAVDVDGQGVRKRPPPTERPERLDVADNRPRIDAINPPAPGPPARPRPGEHPAEATHAPDPPSFVAVVDVDVALSARKPPATPGQRPKARVGSRRVAQAGPPPAGRLGLAHARRLKRPAAGRTEVPPRRRVPRERVKPAAAGQPTLSKPAATASQLTTLNHASM